MLHLGRRNRVTFRLGAGVLALALSLAHSGAASAQDERAALPLRAGAAIVGIETPQGAPLAGYGKRGPGNRHQGRLAPVEARALVLAGSGGRPRIGLVALDILIVTPELRRAVRERVAPLELDGLVIAATHTHSGPGGYAQSRVAELAILGWYDPKVLQAISAAAANALGHAARALTPAALGVAVASGPTLAANRRHPGGPTDPSIPVLRVDGTSGAAIATLFSLAAHPTVLGPENLDLAPDYPGAARALVEARRGGIAIFVAGPIGDQKPHVASAEQWPADPAAQQKNAVELGERLGALVVEAAELATPDAEANVAFAETTYAPPAIDVRAACAGYVFAPLFWAAARATLPSETVLAAAKLGSLRLLASPYELGVEVAARIRAHTQGPLMLIDHANDWLGYLLEPDDFAAGGYESCMAFHGEDAALPFADAAQRVLAPLESAGTSAGGD
jgi:hypothetical protein